MPASHNIDTLHIHRQSHYLFGRDTKVSDVRLDHPSASKQHAVLQFKQKATVAIDGSVESPVQYVCVACLHHFVCFVFGKRHSYLT